MGDAVVVQGVGKRFRRYHVEKPGTIHEALMRGFRKLGPAARFWGLRDVSFRVAPGSMVGVVGRNGAGKSTLLRLIGGIGRPDEGTIKVRGKVRGLLNLGAGFHPELTGRENLFINGVIGGLTRREVAARFDEIVTFAELENFIDTPLRAYSMGMQMRLAFSIAIHARLDVLLIDELLAVGDLAFQQKCLERIREIRSDGCAIIFVSHDAGVVTSLCDEAVWLNAGQLVASGPSAVVVERYLADANSHTWSYLPIANLSNGDSRAVPAAGKSTAGAQAKARSATGESG